MGDKKRILIVDDEPDLLRAIAFRLEIEGYKTLTARDGKRGLELAKKERPDLILLDIKLPVMDGKYVCQRLKSDDNFKKIPVILLTASVVGKRVNIKKVFGADDYILKPFEPEELLNKVKKHIR